jgi:Ulp1 family protease
MTSRAFRAGRVLSNLFHYIRLEHLQYDVQFVDKDWSVRECSEYPTQSNGYDCGCFCIMLADYLALRKPPDYTTEDMVFFRRLICLSIYHKKLM